MYRLILPVVVLLGDVAVAAAQTACPACPAEPAPSRVWASAEYLLWWTKSSPLPVPLATLGSPTEFGVIGAPSTQLAIGNEDLGFGTRHGARFTAGAWLKDEGSIGVEAGYFFLGAATVRRSAAVNGVAQQVLSVPFIDVTPGGAFGDPKVNRENAVVIGAPLSFSPDGAFSGTAVVSVRSRLWGAEANGLMNVAGGDGLRLDVLGGFRYVYLRERLEFATTSPDFPPVPGEFFNTSDTFDARNNFYGGQVGARVAGNFGPLSVSATGKVALGVMRESVNIDGFTATNDFTANAGPGQVFSGAYFSQPTNIGKHSRERFAVVPEASVSVGYQATESLRLSVGYTFLYLSSVVRPGEQIDRVINGGQSAAVPFVPTPPGLQGGPARPAALLRDSDFWAQGVNFGVELRF